MNSSRMKFALRWAGGHLLISLIVALAVAALVFGVWYQSPWRQMLQVSAVLGLVIVVDVVCGPLLTLILSSPTKSRRERWVDLCLVGALQLAALGYGVWAVYAARPVILAFEVDRLVLVTANEVQEDLLPLAPAQLQQLPKIGVQKVGLRQAQSNDEYLNSIWLALEGISQPMRPDWWIAYEAVIPALWARARPLEQLYTKGAEVKALIGHFLQKEKLNADELRFLPLTSGKSMEWIAVVRQDGSLAGALPIDGF